MNRVVYVLEYHITGTKRWRVSNDSAPFTKRSAARHRARASEVSSGLSYRVVRFRREGVV